MVDLTFLDQDSWLIQDMVHLTFLDNDMVDLTCLDKDMVDDYLKGESEHGIF